VLVRVCLRPVPKAQSDFSIWQGIQSPSRDALFGASHAFLETGVLGIFPEMPLPEFCALAPKYSFAAAIAGASPSASFAQDTCRNDEPNVPKRAKPPVKIDDFPKFSRTELL
jgi:hypothetical protein